MLPKWHVLTGAIFSFIVYFFLSITFFQAVLIFISSVFIDVDHHIWFIQRKKDFNLKRAYSWYLKIPKNHKPFMHFFHTLEFFILIFLFSFFWNSFLYILIGMLFHSILDIGEMISYKRLGREHFFIKYLLSDKKQYM
jgi:hypothetical protein